jgi:uncharacterized protein (TIGR02147 family)
MSPGPSVFDYVDYRAFLLAFIEQRKAERKQYSRKAFALAIGFSSDSGLNMVLSGKRDLRGGYLDSCIREMSLSGSQRLYFEALVRAGRLEESERREILASLRSDDARWEAPGGESGLRWIDLYVAHHVLRQSGRFMRPEDVASLYRYPISVGDVGRVLMWMYQAGRLEMRDNAFRSVAFGDLETSALPAGDRDQVHADGLSLARQALQSDDEERREFQTLHFVVSSGELPQLKNDLRAAVFEVFRRFASQTPHSSGSVVQLQVSVVEASRESATAPAAHQ